MNKKPDYYLYLLISIVFGLLPFTAYSVCSKFLVSQDRAIEAALCLWLISIPLYFVHYQLIYPGIAIASGMFIYYGSTLGTIKEATLLSIVYGSTIAILFILETLLMHREKNSKKTMVYKNRKAPNLQPAVIKLFTPSVRQTIAFRLLLRWMSQEEAEYLFSYCDSIQQERNKARKPESSRKIQQRNHIIEIAEALDDNQLEKFDSYLSKTLILNTYKSASPQEKRKVFAMTLRIVEHLHRNQKIPLEGRDDLLALITDEDWAKLLQAVQEQKKE